MFTETQIAQLVAISAKAQAALPACNGRHDKALTLVVDGAVTLHTDGSAQVQSQRDADVTYTVADGQCTCLDTAPQGWCKHRLAVALLKRLQQAEPSPLPAGAGTLEPEPVHASSCTRVPAQYVVMIQGKAFVKFAGLLALAHERGLVELKVEWTYNDSGLSLAHAVAIFGDGRRFEESGDASPENVGKKIAPHFRRMALTRAKARALRDALDISDVSVEELGEE